MGLVYITCCCWITASSSSEDSQRRRHSSTTFIRACCGPPDTYLVGRWGGGATSVTETLSLFLSLSIISNPPFQIGTRCPTARAFIRRDLYSKVCMPELRTYLGRGLTNTRVQDQGTSLNWSDRMPVGPKGLFKLYGSPVQGSMTKLGWQPVIGDIFGQPVEILVFASPTILHVHILQFSFIKLGYILWKSSKRIGNLLAVLNFNRLFLKLNQFICN